MRFFSSPRILASAVLALGIFAAFSLVIGNVPAHLNHSTVKAASTCSDDSGLKLPPGFCATIFADDIGHARHLVVSADNVVYVNTWSGRYYGNKPTHEGGFLVALQDKSGSGKADVIQRFGLTEADGSRGGTGVGLYNGWIYAEMNDKIVRYKLPAGSIVPTGAPETIVSGLPLNGDHPMHPFYISTEGMLYVDVATATNACQEKNRTLQSPGITPCTELETRGGIWRFDAKKTGQTFSPAERYATGIRNAEGFGVDKTGNVVYITQHGRDQLHANWPSIYKPEQEATLPSEEVMILKDHGDYGWPECYYDPGLKRLILAPEYGGDGSKAGVCSTKTGPFAAFPAHWGPNGMVFYDRKQFPAAYQRGLFIAFHGSWDRAPYTQGGYNIVYQAITRSGTPGRCEIFADGFAGGTVSPDGATHRPSGVAEGSDGALYVADDVAGRIYRITYVGGNAASTAAPNYTPCPSLTAAPEEASAAAAQPPEGNHADAGNAALPVPEGATQEQVALGDRIYHGQVNGAPCMACHGANGGGTPLGPDLTKDKWLWSDGSWKGIAKTIDDGVLNPKQYRSAMPAKGGAQLTPEQVEAVAAYVWSISHHK
ncbi:c-type cytochrome [Acidicapsa dinghuensis]|uniref:C-type cytochrome n=1 Tax=Acidicapsa dinghuensis TaxID=2218256 RepID=A0ABW1EIX5_9BACT|nr:c-type cytochrome [Acidicapsa dinghuensis]